MYVDVFLCVCMYGDKEFSLLHMYVCVCVCLYVWVYSVITFTWVGAFVLWGYSVYMCTRVYVCVCMVWVYSVNTFTRVCASVLWLYSVYSCTCVCVCLYVWVYSVSSVYKYMYGYTVFTRLHRVLSLITI